jgi:hypothetical protein
MEPRICLIIIPWIDTGAENELISTKKEAKLIYEELIPRPQSNLPNP